MVPRQPPGITGALPGTRPPRVEAEFLDVHGACAFTSLSRRTLDYAKDRGDLPFIRCGAKILFRRGDLSGPRMPLRQRAKARVVMLAIAKIVTDGRTQVRSVTDPSTVEDYAEAMRAGTVFPPVVVFHDGDRYHLADGFHRVMAADRIGCTEITADIRTGTAKEALWFALGANARNGLRLSAADKRNAVVIALSEFTELSHGAIAEQVGCSRGYVSQIAEELVSGNQLERPERTVGRDGKTRRTRHQSEASLPAPAVDSGGPSQETTAPAPAGPPEDAATLPAGGGQADPRPAAGTSPESPPNRQSTTAAGCSAPMDCPFCGGNRVSVRDQSRGDSPRFAVACTDCEANGPAVTEWEARPQVRRDLMQRRPLPLDRAALPQEAIALWNRASRLPQTPTPTPSPAPVDPERVERFVGQFMSVLEATPREEWPDAVEAMRRIIAEVGGQAQ